jgi:hypothetical protein
VCDFLEFLWGHGGTIDPEALASDPAGDLTVAAWEDDEPRVWSRTFSAGDFLDPVLHGPGKEPTLIHSAAGFTLAYAWGQRS